MAGIEYGVEQSVALHGRETRDRLAIVSCAPGDVGSGTTLQPLPLQQATQLSVICVVVEHGAGEFAHVIQTGTRAAY